MSSTPRQEPLTRVSAGGLVELATIEIMPHARRCVGCNGTIMRGQQGIWTTRPTRYTHVGCVDTEAEEPSRPAKRHRGAKSVPPGGGSVNPNFGNVAERPPKNTLATIQQVIHAF